LLHLYSKLKNEYISLRIKAANDETLLSAKSLDALHHRGSCNNCLKASLQATRNLLTEYWNIQVGEGSRGGYPPDPDAILRYPGNVLVGPSDNRARISESESEEDVEVNEPVSARTRARETKTDSWTTKGEQSGQRSRQSRRVAVYASSVADATVIYLTSVQSDVISSDNNLKEDIES